MCTLESPLQQPSRVISISLLSSLPCSVLCISFISCSVLANLCWISPASDKGQSPHRGVDLWIVTSHRAAMAKRGHSISVSLFPQQLLASWLFVFLQ